ncbi:MAG: lytic transglycosylase domain-containing protein [Leptospira sp.]|nr:lytic transglycosylase domain-containing protein [Leptospira sp.]
MEISNLPSLQSVFSRMRELEKLTTDPSQVLTFPEMIERELGRSKTSNNGAEKIDPNTRDQNFKPPLLPPTDISSTKQSALRDDGLESFIQKTAEAKGIDPNLVKAVIKTESGFKPNAVSPKGALGLMQLMPSTADMLGVDDPMDPKENIIGGTTYLKDMLTKFGDTEKALAAYNAGPGAVKKYGGVPPYAETQDYIQKVKKNFYKYSKED